jgi:hypothetical protein
MEAETPSPTEPRHILIVFALQSPPENPLPSGVTYPWPAGNIIGIMAVARALAADMMLHQIGVARCTGCGELNTGQIYIMCDNAPTALRIIQTTLEALCLFTQCAIYLFDDAELIFRRVHSHATGLLPESLKCEDVQARLAELQHASLANIYYFKIVATAALLPEPDKLDTSPDHAA